MSARSVVIVVCNLTTTNLTLVNQGLSHGRWSSQPPSTIAGVTVNIQFRSESHGVATGTQGFATYSIGPASGTVDLNWDNPFVGKNSYASSAPNGFTCSW
jgi:hypothetical protein